jgi:hypothetical protein
MSPEAALRWITLWDKGFVGTRMSVEPEGALATTEYETLAGTATVMSPELSLRSTSSGGRVKERSISPEPSSAWTFVAEM